jgi:hypothetical protein
MDHIIADLGFALLRAPLPDLFGGEMTDFGFGDGVSFAGTRAFQHSAKILNCELRVQPLDNRETRTASFGNSLKTRLRRMICASDASLDLISYVDENFKQETCWLSHTDIGLPSDGSDAVIKTRSEQAPNYHSRITLVDEQDRLGMRRAAVEWRLLDVDKQTLKTTMLELGRYFAKADIGRIRVADWVLDDGLPVAGMAEGERSAHGGHHIGTTRMAASPGLGVVDQHCKVFGTRNLYIAGSSVFPTGGHAPPTLTIVQLALRLADHLAALAEQHGSGVAVAATSD